MTQTTLSRLLESVFSGGEFAPKYTNIKNDDINKVLERKRGSIIHININVYRCVVVGFHKNCMRRVKPYIRS